MDKADELGKIYQEIFQCTKCHPNVYASKVPRRVLENTLHSKIVFMAQAPSDCGVRISGVHWNKEDGTMTRAGSFLDKQTDIIKYSVNFKSTTQRPYTTNVLQCWTGRAGKGRDRTPNDDELINCKKYWQAELNIIKPPIMILRGAPAIEAFSQVIGKKWTLPEMLKSQGEYITIGDIKLIVFGLPHPSASYKEDNEPYRKQTQLYQERFQKIKRILNI
jgi:uracil-DNA glycosylase family 4